MSANIIHKKFKFTCKLANRTTIKINHYIFISLLKIWKQIVYFIPRYPTWLDHQMISSGVNSTNLAKKPLKLIYIKSWGIKKTSWDLYLYLPYRFLKYLYLILDRQFFFFWSIKLEKMLNKLYSISISIWIWIKQKVKSLNFKSLLNFEYELLEF